MGGKVRDIGVRLYCIGVWGSKGILSTTGLSLPVDIPWIRLAYSWDMIDLPPLLGPLVSINFDPTQFGSNPPTWRPSSTLFYYVVDPALTSDDYPDGRIIYLRLSCSITGYNLSEDLTAEPNVPGSFMIYADDPNSTMTGNTLLESIAGSDWANTYYPCLGAVAQILPYSRIARLMKIIFRI